MSVEEHDGRLPAPEEGLLLRWSRRKAQARAGQLEPEPDSAPPPEPPTAAETAVEPEPAVKIDPRTGKPYDELTDADMPALETLNAFSDLSMFMAKNVSAGLRMRALSRVFAAERYNRVCICAEYADDYTQFTPLGDIVPHDLKATLLREAKRLHDALLTRGEPISLEEAQARVTADRQWRLPEPEPEPEPAAAGRRTQLAAAERADDGKAG